MAAAFRQDGPLTDGARATIPLARPSISNEEVDAVARVLSSRHLAQGPESAAFEHELSPLTGGREVTAVTNGGAALLLSLAAAGIGPGDEVIVPDFVFPAAAQAAMFLRAVPVAADVDEDLLAVTPDTVRSRLSARTRAVVVVHPFGIPADVEMVIDACPAGMTIIEDAACALGGLTGAGNRTGSAGRFGCFSFHPRKSITTGEGGCIVTSGSDTETVRLLRDYGRKGRGYGDVFPDVGLNFRLSDINAAVGRVQLRRLEASIAVRAGLAAEYMRLLESVPGVRVPDGFRRPGNTFQSLVVETAADPRQVIERLVGLGIQAGQAAQSITGQTVYRKSGSRTSACPVGARLASSTMALPLYDEMDPGEVAEVVSALKMVLGS